jgi:hypothetical protein
MRKFTKKQYLVAGVAALVIAGTAGTALAYWTSTGSGSGSATTGSDTSSLAITDLSTPSNLAPGVTAGAVTFTVTNSGTSSAHVNQVTISLVSISGAGTDAGKPACTTADYTLSNPVQTVNQTIAPSGHFDASASTATLGFNSTAANQDNCQGATVNLAYASN